ncbi:hypothetical protein EKO04_007050 [Ascochyta lentis]|uniref:DUF7607 domain-containing protein n=1 Tax=Ascochyta lentis TaxID=205686 RepID=A0A8H7J0N1_9PLEO|nr:hypothetical protein EKO04_007050 [Ascochyta lentis]
MSWSTPTASAQALQLTKDRTPETSNGVSGPNHDDRKRRRIAPINSTTVPLTGDALLEKAYDTPSQAPLESWHYLSKWQAADGSIVELDDLEEEEHYSNVSDTSPEGVEEPGYESGKSEDLPAGGYTLGPSNLDKDRVTEIINECIEVYTNAWKPGKGETKHKDERGVGEAPVVYDIATMRKEAEAAGQREKLVRTYLAEAEYYRYRIDKICDEILEDPGDTVASVKMKCRNLEVTVELLEQANWLASVYETPSDSNNGDDSQTEDSVVSNNPHLPAAQPLERSQQQISPVEFIDLGTPSDSSDFESDHEPLKDGSTTPARNKDKREPSTQTRVLAPEPMIADTIETPNLVAAAATLTARSSRTPLGDAPEHASIATVSRWTWPQLIETQDRKRIVSKAIHDLSPHKKEMIRQRLQNVGRTNMIREIPACVDMLLRGDARMPGILPQDLPKIVTFTKLFLCWWLCGDYFSEEPSKQGLEELARCLRQNSPDPATFCDYVDTILNTTFSHAALSNPMQPSQAEIIEISDDDEPLVPVSK